MAMERMSGADALMLYLDRAAAASTPPTR